jgi:hypothetical protein
MAPIASSDTVAGVTTMVVGTGGGVESRQAARGNSTAVAALKNVQRVIRHSKGAYYVGGSRVGETVARRSAQLLGTNQL